MTGAVEANRVSIRRASFQRYPLKRNLQPTASAFLTYQHHTHVDTQHEMRQTTKQDNKVDGARFHDA